METRNAGRRRSATSRSRDRICANQPLTDEREVKHRDMRGQPYPLYLKGRALFGLRKGRVVGRYKHHASPSVRMTMKACMRMADAEQHGRGILRVLR